MTGACLLIVLTLTAPCADDMLAWDAVSDADVVAYRIYEVNGTIETLAWEVPAPATSALLGCPLQETTYCVRAADASGNRSPRCSNRVVFETIDCGTFSPDGSCTEWRQIGRFMWFG
jgi:hypothetical protein